ncbi:MULTISPECIES: hypothetical protein [unclassified Enterococcus]|uniref:hypothetical protein n=1 Tax=unclassified Enterococcus TaxID=2608891 RepID=UPI001CE0B415|nr:MULTISPECIES: hypothetical protein [unclassified Enterococcus]MCA5014125.1 hypothetical protein [Enterococcus sp. S23]MCA5017655.1 hypothetical protein [Enterococcus sp. S22(2020)]
MAMKRRNISMLLGIFILLLLVGSGVIYFHKEGKKSEMKEPAVYTKQKLSNIQVRILVSRLYLDADPSITLASTNTKQENENMTLTTTDDTEKAVVVLNYYLFYDLSDYDKKGYEKAVEYGFNKEKLITIDWIMDNKKKAFDILYAMFDANSLFEDRNAILRTYERVKEEVKMD